MKNSLAIAVILSLVILLAMAVPALAVGKAAQGELFPTGNVTGAGQYVLQSTPDSHIRVTIVLYGAVVDNYDVYLIPNDGSCGESVGIFTVNNGGTGHFTGVTDSSFTVDDLPFLVRVYNNAGGINDGVYSANDVVVTFKD